ncbi:MAG: hypothetical protein DYH08_01420 [Actinobacteria bacterium ATB1]|nr:hypothetical protein [Actinobacteria bacterium ATB1]
MADIFGELENVTDVTRHGEPLAFHLDESASRSLFEGSVRRVSRSLPLCREGRLSGTGSSRTSCSRVATPMRAVISYDAVNAAMPVTPPPV